MQCCLMLGGNNVCTLYEITYWGQMSSDGKEVVSPGQYSSHLEMLTYKPREGPNSCIRDKDLQIEDLLPAKIPSSRYKA